jgi:hypothetical protein
MLAIENGHVDTVLYLIANGAIVNARDIQGRTALHRGVSNCVTEKLYILFAYLWSIDKSWPSEFEIYAIRDPNQI